MPKFRGAIPGGETSHAHAIAVFSILRKRKLLAFTAMCAGIGIVLAGAHLISPSFDASATLVVGTGRADRSTDSTQLARTNASLARIAESEEVIRAAVQKVGLDQLVEKPSDEAPARFGVAALLHAVMEKLENFETIRPWLENFQASSQTSAAPITPLDRAIPVVSHALKVKAEANSDVIHISFQHKNSVVAAAFANAVAEAFIDRQLQLYNLDGAAAFYDRQATLFADKVKRASDEIHSFAQANAAYSIEDQKLLLLKRASELSTTLFTTRAAIADKGAQADALALQLHKLKPVTQSRFVSNVVDELAPQKVHEEGAPRELTVHVGRPTTVLSLDSAAPPPLLMVKVYQELMVLLFKENAELAGLKALESETARQVDVLNGELNQLEAKEAEYLRLKRAVDDATLNADTYQKRAVEDSVNARLAEAKISSVKVLQFAYAPLKSNFPGYWVIGLIALLSGLICSLGATLATEFLTSPVGRQLKHDLADVWERDVKRPANDALQHDSDVGDLPKEFELA